MREGGTLCMTHLPAGDSTLARRKGGREREREKGRGREGRSMRACGARASEGEGAQESGESRSSEAESRVSSNGKGQGGKKAGRCGGRGGRAFDPPKKVPPTWEAVHRMRRTGWRRGPRACPQTQNPAWWGCRCGRWRRDWWPAIERWSEAPPHTRGNGGSGGAGERGSGGAGDRVSSFSARTLIFKC